MKIKTLLSVVTLLLVAGSIYAAKKSSPAILGDYVEVRSCDVYTGSCFANAEMNLAGKEGILVWSIREGQWNNTPLAGLSVIAVVRTEETLGNLRYEPREGQAVLIVDAKANARQKEALVDFARSMAGPLASDVVEVKTSSVEVNVNACQGSGCAAVKAGQLVEIHTRCLIGKDHVCSNEEIYYPPMIDVQNAMPVFTELSAYRGSGLGLTWQGVGQRNAFLATFAR